MKGAIGRAASASTLSPRLTASTRAPSSTSLKAPARDAGAGHEGDLVLEAANARHEAGSRIGT